MSDFSVATADMDQYRLQLAGFNISNGAGASGYADGEWFTAKQLATSFTAVEGTDGSIARSKTNRRLCEFSVNLLQTCASNAFLSGLLAMDEALPNGAGIGSLVLMDLSETTLIRCTRVWLVGPPEVSLDRGAKERKWVLQGPKSVYLVGGN